MAEYIKMADAIIIADYAVDEHPYDKDPKNPETFSDYNRGWNDACDYIRDRLEREKPADMEGMQNEAYDLGYQSALRYKGLSWTEAEELQHYRGARMDGDTHE